MVAVSLALGLALAAGSVIGFTGAISSTLGQEMTYWMNEQRQSKQPSAPDFIEFRRRGIIDKKEYNLLMSREGFNEERAKQFWEASRQILGVGELITLFRRGYIKVDEFAEGAIKLGIDPEVAIKLLQATEYFPSANDLVRFAVREVYTPEIVSKFELDVDLPEQFITEANKAGMPKEQAINFWRSHWVLPSVQLGYEMLHRGVINPEELDLLMKTQDVMPFWRDKLKQISYTPYTRVDVRRMYQTGVLTKDDVHRSYLDIGYDEEKAEKMTEFTIAFSEPTERELTRIMIVKGYEQGEITREECITYLGQIGYDSENADYLLALEENKWNEATQKQQIDTLTTLFKGGLMTQEVYIANLDKLNIKASFRNKLVARALTIKKTGAKLPTTTNVRDWLKLDLINVDQFKAYYLNLGYAELEINIYLDQIFLDRLEETEVKARQANPKLIPRATLTSLFIEGTIDEKRLKKGFKELRFRTEDIEILVTSAKIKKAEKEEKEK